MRVVIPVLFALAVLPAAEPGYDLHEWGVFTVNPGNPFAQQDYREEWASFPDFFTKQPQVLQAAKAGGKPGMIVRKPVVFLQADGDLVVDLTFTLRGGTPLVWWPEAAVNGETLRFTASLWDKQTQNRDRTPIMEGPAVPAGHWLEYLRGAGGDFLLPTQKTARPAGDNFLYYDGLIPAPASPRIETLGSDKHQVLALTNHATYPLLDAQLIWNTADGTTLTSEWVASIAAGARIEMPVLQRPPSGPSTRAVLGNPLETRLIAAGLAPLEAKALVDIWDQELFQRPGLTLLYRLPQATYDALLPMTANPAPRHTVRVGVMVHQHLEPSLTADLHALIDTLGKAPEHDRPALLGRLKEYGGAAFPVLRERLTANGPEAPTCRMLLAALDLGAP